METQVVEVEYSGKTENMRLKYGYLELVDITKECWEIIKRNKEMTDSLIKVKDVDVLPDRVNFWMIDETGKDVAIVEGYYYLLQSLNLTIDDLPYINSLRELDITKDNLNRQPELREKIYKWAMWNIWTLYKSTPGWGYHK